MYPEWMKWDAERKTWFNVAMVILALAWTVIFIAGFLLSAFVASLFSLAKKS